MQQHHCGVFFTAAPINIKGQELPLLYNTTFLCAPENHGERRYIKKAHHTMPLGMKEKKEY